MLKAATHPALIPSAWGRESAMSTRMVMLRQPTPQPDAIDNECLANKYSWRLNYASNICSKYASNMPQVCLKYASNICLKHTSSALQCQRGVVLYLPNFHQHNVHRHQRASVSCIERKWNACPKWRVELGLEAM